MHLQCCATLTCGLQVVSFVQTLDLRSLTNTLLSLGCNVNHLCSRLFRLLNVLHEWEGQDFLDRVVIRKEHHKTIDTHSPPTCRWQSVLERLAEGLIDELRLVITLTTVSTSSNRLVSCLCNLPAAFWFACSSKRWIELAICLLHRRPILPNAGRRDRSTLCKRCRSLSSLSVCFQRLELDRGEGRSFWRRLCDHPSPGSSLISPIGLLTLLANKGLKALAETRNIAVVLGQRAHDLGISANV